MSIPVTAVRASEGKYITSAIRATMKMQNSVEAIMRVARLKRSSSIA